MCVYGTWQQFLLFIFMPAGLIVSFNDLLSVYKF